MLSEIEIENYLKTESKVPQLNIRQNYAFQRAMQTNYFKNSNIQELSEIADDLGLSLEKTEEFVEEAAGEVLLIYLEKEHNLIPNWKIEGGEIVIAFDELSKIEKIIDDMVSGQDNNLKVNENT